MQATVTSLGHGPGGKESGHADGRSADPLHGLDTAVESAVGADMRLLYGFLAPILFVCGMIIVLALAPSYWLVAAALAPEVALLFFIVTKIMAMLNEPEEGETARSTH